MIFTLTHGVRVGVGSKLGDVGLDGGQGGLDIRYFGSIVVDGVVDISLLHH